MANIGDIGEQPTCKGFDDLHQLEVPLSAESNQDRLGRALNAVVLEGHSCAVEGRV